MNQENIDSKICPICGRLTHKESKYCIFHASAEEKTEEEFKKALKEYVHEIEKENKDYNFSLFIFVGEIDFSKVLNITIFTNVNFGGVTFEDNANFKGITFEGNANFGNAAFEGDDIFGGTTVNLNSFWTKTFKKNTKLVRTTFKKKAYFRGTIFKRDAGFVGTLFRGDADFIRAIIEENANFVMADFEGNTYFDQVTFKVDSNFSGTTFKGDISFSYTTLVPATMLEIKLAKKGIIKFEYTNLENVILDLDLDEGVLIDFSNALLRNTRTKKEQIENHILQEKEEEFSKASEIYLLLKNNFHSIGRYDDESWAYKKEKDMDRLSHSFPYYKKVLKEESEIEKFPILKWIKKGDFIKWIISGFSNIIYGYGEKPWNVIRAAVVIIVLFAFSFSLIGIGKPEIIELKGSGIYQNSGNIVDLSIKGFFENSEIRNFPDSLYFSLITFTTLGYGDFRPLEGLGRILAGSEAFLGAIMMALFVYTFARRTGGR